jgi:16S rRNA (guanine527-N7)-methyltransferase
VGSDLLRRQLERARDLGFLGPGPVEAHLTHAIGLADDLHARGMPRPGMAALDLGSGGGVPGLVLVDRWPTTRWVLLDASERRTDFLAEAIEAMAVGHRVSVVRARAERAGRDPELRGGFDLVTARSFAPPAVTAECGAAFLTNGGLLAVSEPPVPDPTRWPRHALDELGLELVADGRWALLRQCVPLAERYPRREGVPAKRPLW